MPMYSIMTATCKCLPERRRSVGTRYKYIERGFISHGGYKLTMQNLATPAMTELRIQRLLSVQLICNFPTLTACSPVHRPKIVWLLNAVWRIIFPEFLFLVLIVLPTGVRRLRHL